jgi:uncharacterized protein (TIGR03067 family)
MNRKNRWFNIAATLVVALTIHADAMPLGPAVASAKNDLSEQGKLDGIWLVQSAKSDMGSLVSRAWISKITIGAGKFTVSHFCGSSHDLKGTYRLDPAVAPKTVNLSIERIELSELWQGVAYPSCNLPGIYEIDGDLLTVCLRTSSKLPRPSAFSADDNDTIILSLVRADANFKDFPKNVTVTVVDPAGKPTAGASVFRYMMLDRDQAKDSGPTDWRYLETTTTNAHGIAGLAYDDLAVCSLAVRDAGRKLMGLCAISPASLQNGTVKVNLRPECNVTGRLVCEELAAGGEPIWTNAYLLFSGQRIGEYDAVPGEGEFEFHVPAGRYTVDVSGKDLKNRYVDFTVPADRRDFQLPPIRLTASNLVLLRGKPAPELEGVVGWRGAPVKLAELKGKYVLLDFWGYWCGPCVHAMPVLIDLHERFKDKGLVIVGVHCDMNGEIDTPAKLDEKIAPLKEKVWKGKDLTFPVALTTKSSSYSEQMYDGTAAAQYGVLSYPTTILIDKEGKVVGQFAARDTKKAIADVEELLAPKR